jgi:hypothetical protein
LSWASAAAGVTTGMRSARTRAGANALTRIAR